MGRGDYALGVAFKKAIHRSHTQMHVRPDAVDDKTVVVDMKKLVWDSDSVEACALLILKLGVWDPHVTYTSLVQF